MKNGDVCSHEWLTQDGVDKRKCPKHGAWRKKGKCEMCLREQDLKRQEVERKKQLDYK